MAKDIKLIWDEEESQGDIKFQSGDLIREEGLETAIFISLFTDRRAKEDDILDDPNDRRGWWGDKIAEVEDDQIGSRLWILDRSKTTQETLVEARSIIKESLEWLTEDGVAKSYEVEVERDKVGDNEALTFKVTVYKVDGNTEVFEFEDVWNEQFGL